MILDVVSIFPDYLAPLDLSLIGKARRDGLLDLRVHDLRDFAHDRHRTRRRHPLRRWRRHGDEAAAVGRGARRTWSPRADAGRVPRPRLVVPGPGGMPFTQALARELAEEPWLAFACGRYEGIDERVYEYAADDLGLEVSVVSLGDYVLNGGEVAVLAMVEAVARLLPGRHRQRRVARRGVARGRPARVPRLHQAGLVGVDPGRDPRGAAGPAVR